MWCYIPSPIGVLRTSAKSIGFGGGTSRSVMDFEVELAEFLSPSDLSLVEQIGGIHKVTEVMVIGVNLDREVCAMAIVSPYLLSKYFDDGEEFFVVYRVVPFAWLQFTGVEGDRVEGFIPSL